MGAANVTAAYAMYPHLPDRAMRLLAWMAVRSLDDDNPDTGTTARRYFGGRDDLVEALGRRPTTPTQRSTAYRQVRKALAQLRDSGAIERLLDGRQGARSVYLVRVSSVEGRGYVGHPLQGVREVPPQGVREVPPQGVPRVPPKENEGTTEENGTGQPTSGSSSHLARATTTANSDDVDGFERDRAALLAAGEDNWQRALESAHKALPNASMRERIAYASRELERGVAPA